VVVALLDVMVLVETVSLQQLMPKLMVEMVTPIKVALEVQLVHLQARLVLSMEMGLAQAAGQKHNVLFHWSLILVVVQVEIMALGLQVVLVLAGLIQ